MTQDGLLIVVEKPDTTANMVTVTGNVRGTAGASIVLTAQNDVLGLRSKLGGRTWRPPSKDVI